LVSQKVERTRSSHMPLVRKPFAEFAVELAAGLAAGRGDEPLAESATFEVWRPGTGACASSSTTRSRSSGTRASPHARKRSRRSLDRLEGCPDWDAVRTVPIQ